MKVQIRPSFAELTAPLLPPDILGGFEALADGRCSVPELTGAVLEACRDDPNATDAVLLLLEGYSSSGEFERLDLGPLKRALERSGEIQEPTSDIEPGPLDGEPLRDSAAAPQASLSAVDEPAGHLADIPESEEVDRTFAQELVDPCADLPAVAAVDKPRVLRERYILEAVIGRGGVGTVYRALDLNRAGLPPGHRHVAVKILGENAVRRAEAVDSLRCEYHQAQLLSHPGIVNVFDFDHDGDTHFVTMELIDGESVGESMRRLFPNKLPLDAAMRILRELGDAIVYAHDRGVLHLDLKPDT